MNEILEKLNRLYPEQPEFLQAVTEVLESISDFVRENPHYMKEKILERIVEPERIIIFRVPWLDDKGEIHINKGYRVQFNSAIGPYKGGFRFHPLVNLDVIKSLAFEQVFKNALTTLQMGGGKGGSNFDPKGKSDNDVMRFCQSFMTGLYKHIGPDTDVPAGDIGVGDREIGFLFGQYKRLANEFTGALTGKRPNWGGSFIRPEATGYGLIYFAAEMLETQGESIEGKVCLVSGAGNVAQYTVEKIIQMGGKAVTLSDSNGMVYDPDGIDEEKLVYVKDLKNAKRGRIREYAEKYPGVKYIPVDHKAKSTPLWDVKADCAFPSATENEINANDAQNLIKNGVMLVAEGANMPCTPEAIHIFLQNKILYGPGKAANAGGVTVSGLEMSQDSSRLKWTRERVDNRLQMIMKAIHDQCTAYGIEGDFCNYEKGANIAGFKKVADAMLDQGLV